MHIFLKEIIILNFYKKVHQSKIIINYKKKLSNLNLILTNEILKS